MKLTTLEQVSIAVTALALTAMTGFFIGVNSGVGTERIAAPLSAAPSPSISAADTHAPPPEEQDEEQPVRFPLDINSATAEELQALPGIGAARAQAIVDYRVQNGPFRYVEDLRGVNGIGEGILAKIMDYVTVGEGSDG